MDFFSSRDWRFVQLLAELNACNPFTERRLDLERQLLGSDCDDARSGPWSLGTAGGGYDRPNVRLITERVEQLVGRGMASLEQEERLTTEAELVGWGDLVAHALYYRHIVDLPLEEEMDQEGRDVAQVWHDFRADYDLFYGHAKPADAGLESPSHLFACMHQVRRAFRNIFDHIIGKSRKATELRSQVWESIFTHDLRRYRRTYFRRMNEIPTLILGPSGTGKGLVAQAIALSQYIVFDERRASFVTSGARYLAVNLAAVAPTLVESELFGHSRGAFTGAIVDRAGWLEVCPASGAVFLDELGELDPSIQVKLLRVVQERAFSRLGESAERSFAGKLIAATNRDLPREIEAGHFRSDLYYRLCADVIHTPSLRAQLDENEADIEDYVEFISRRVAGREADQVKLETLAWIDEEMPDDYQWSGNIRELEQCVRNVMVRKRYQFHPQANPTESTLDWVEMLKNGRLPADEVLRNYCGLVYQNEGSYEKAAKILGIDRRTVRKYMTSGTD